MEVRRAARQVRPGQDKVEGLTCLGRQVGQFLSGLFAICRVRELLDDLVERLLRLVRLPCRQIDSGQLHQHGIAWETLVVAVDHFLRDCDGLVVLLRLNVDIDEAKLGHPAVEIRVPPDSTTS